MLTSSSVLVEDLHSAPKKHSPATRRGEATATRSRRLPSHASAAAIFLTPKENRHAAKCHTVTETGSACSRTSVSGNIDDHLDGERHTAPRPTFHSGPAQDARLNTQASTRATDTTAVRKKDGCEERGSRSLSPLFRLEDACKDTRLHIITRRAVRCNKSMRRQDTMFSGPTFLFDPLIEPATATRWSAACKNRLLPLERETRLGQDGSDSTPPLATR